MTREHAKEFLPIITAFANGEAISYINSEEETFSFDGNVKNYRIVKPKNRTIKDGLVVGDIVVDRTGDERTVIAVDGNIVHVSKYDNIFHHGVTCTLQELIDTNNTLKQEEVKEETQSFTLKQVSNGEANGIPSHLIRIKE